MKSKIIRKILLLLIGVIFTTSCSGKQNSTASTKGLNKSSGELTVQEKKWSEEFSSWMNAGKNAEEEEKWFHALISYLMALRVYENYDEAQIAYNSYTELADIIKNGSPGRGSFDIFSSYEAWKKLLIMCESFWNEFFPYELYFGSIEPTNINMEKKVADYSVTVSFAPNIFYLKTAGLISTGYEKVDKKGWNDLPESFPSFPVSKESLYIQNAFATSHNEKYSPFAYVFPSCDSLKLSVKNISIIPYEAVFVLTDENGVEFAESSPYVIGSREDSVGGNELEYLFGDIGYGGVIKFKNVPQDGIKAVEAGKAKVLVKNVNLIYGDIKAEELLNGRRYLNGNKHKEVSVISNDSYYVRAKLIFAVADAQLKSFDASCYVGSRKVHCLYFAPEELDFLFNGGNRISGTEMLCLMCNELSKLYGRTPVYLSNGSYDACNFINGNGEISKNDSANGFRLETIEGIKEILSYAPAGSNLPALVEDKGWFSSTYNYYSMDENYKEGSYLLLYYLE